MFTVKHRRDTQQGAKALTDARDIYEMIANQAARRVRTCILSLIPGDVIDAALKQCDVTLAAQNNGAPTADLVGKLLGAFQAEYEITPDMIAGYIGKNIEAFDNKDLTHLRRIYTSLKEGIVGNDYFTNRMRNSARTPEKAPPAISPSKEGVDSGHEEQKAPEAQSGGETDNLPFEMGLDDL